MVEFFKSLCSLSGKDFLIHNANTELFNHTTTAFTNLWFVAFELTGLGLVPAAAWWLVPSYKVNNLGDIREIK